MFRLGPAGIGDADAEPLVQRGGQLRVRKGIQPEVGQARLGVEAERGTGDEGSAHLCHHLVHRKLPVRLHRT